MTDEGFPPEVFSAMFKTWHGDGKLTEDEQKAIEAVHRYNDLGEPDLKKYIKRNLRNAYKKYSLSK